MELTEEEKELNMMRDMFAGIVLPGIVARTGMFDNPMYIAEQCYNIAEAMLKEREIRLTKTRES